MSKFVKPILLVLPLVAALLLWGCAPAAAPSATATKAPASAGGAPATSSSSGLSPAGEKAAAQVPAAYKGKKSPYTLNDKAAIDAGEKIYKQSCLTCHGEKGDGKGPAGSALNPPPVNYSTSEQQEHFEKIQDHHFWTISEGVAGSAMTAFKGQLTEEQRWQVFMYEWQLGKASKM